MHCKFTSKLKDHWLDGKTQVCGVDVSTCSGAMTSYSSELSKVREPIVNDVVCYWFCFVWCDMKWYVERQ